MGSSTSKAARTAVGTARKYPSRVPTSSGPTNMPSASPSVNTSPASTSTPSPSSFENFKDPALSARLSQLGPVTLPPTQSNSSAFNPNDNQFTPSASSPSQSIFPSPASNPAVTLLVARSRLAAEADEEFANIGRSGHKRGVLDVLTIRQVLKMRDEDGLNAREIERMLGLKVGIVGKLGPRGLVSGSGVSAYDGQL